MTHELFISMSDGRCANQKQLDAFLAALPNGRFLLKAENKNKRTSPQNRYMHMMFGLIQKGFVDVGYREVRDLEMAKELMKRMFLSRTIENGTGGKIEVVLRTRDLTKEQMAQFIDECIQFSAENLNVVIPPPGQQVSIWDDVVIAEQDEEVGATIIKMAK